MGLVLFALFLGIPIAEIALFVVIGEQIGVLATIAIVILTAIAGAWLVRRQGLETLAKARADIDRNVLPTGAMSEGLAILVAGALLLTPGFLTDAIGFTLLIPPARRTIVSAIARWLAGRVTVVEMGGAGPRRGTAGGPGGRHGRRDDVIDVEAYEIEIDTDGTGDAKSGDARLGDAEPGDTGSGDTRSGGSSGGGSSGSRGRSPWRNP